LILELSTTPQFVELVDAGFTVELLTVHNNISLSTTNSEVVLYDTSSKVELDLSNNRIVLSPTNYKVELALTGSSSTSSEGTTDHSELSNLDYASSGHTGFAPASHSHSGESGVSDHGELTGLEDDDHTQYHNDSRGDSRYSQLDHSHDAYDGHIASGEIHFTEASIDHGSISGLDDNDHPQYSLSGHTHGSYDGHMESGEIHFTESSIDHTAIQNIGSNTHNQIDSHISDSSIHFESDKYDGHMESGEIHFTEASIDHTDIQNIGSNTHNQIDSHISDSSIHFESDKYDGHIDSGEIHFTEASIDHTAIQNIGSNTHSQIDTHISNTEIHFESDKYDGHIASGEIHRQINDSASSSTSLWSSTKISGELATKLDINATAFDIELGTPSDGSWSDGVLASWSVNTKVVDALDDINELMSYLAPDDASALSGTLISNATTYSGYLSAGNVNYKGSEPAGTSVTSKIVTAGFTLTTPSTSTIFNKADEGIVSLMVNGVEADTYDLESNFNEANRDTNQSTPVGDAPLTVTSWGCYNSFPKWQKANAQAVITTAMMRQGYNYFTIKRTGISPEQESSTYEVFYDNDSGANPSVSTPTVAELSPSWTYRSGLKMYGRGSTFNVDCVVSNAFNNVYAANPLSLSASSGSWFTTATVSPSDGSVSGVSSPPAIGETMTVNDKVITIPASNVRSTNARLVATPSSPYGSHTTATSSSSSRLVDGYANQSTDLSETFDDENYRLPAGSYTSVPGAITGQWDSTWVLDNSTYVGAQVYNGSLYYPSTNFSGYLPSGNPNYSSLTGDRTFYRAYYDNGDPHSSGTLTIGNISYSNISVVGSGSINVEIKLPGVTGWLDFGKAYDSGTFTGADGDGCHTGSSSDWTWSCGSFSTASSGYMVIVRITLKNTTYSLTQAVMSGW